jgi:hypothetical protein
MIRPVTCITALLACGSGLYLYQTKHQAQMVDRQIEHTAKAITATKMQTRELAAAWTVLGSPDRLQQLSEQYLDIKPMQPSQFVAMADLDSRLPAPRALLPPSSEAPPDSGPDATPIAAMDPPASPSVSPNASSTPLATPAASSPRSAPAAARALAAIPPSAPAPTQAAEAAQLASRPPDRQPLGRQPPDRQPPDHQPNDPTRASRDVTQTHPAPPQRAPSKPPMIAELDRPTRTEPQRLPSAPMTGSVLGMAHSTVAPPVPMPVSTMPFNVNRN